MSEVLTVQKPMQYYAEEIGWDIISPAEAKKWRGGNNGLYFAHILKQQLLHLNPNTVNETAAENIIRELNLLRPTIEGNREALRWLKGLHSIFVTSENRERNISLIDYEQLDNNVFQITSEWTQQGAKGFNNRADIVFLINGIPICIAETKNPKDPHALEKGITQLRRYQRETPELMIATQVFEVSQMFNLMYGVTWNTSRKNLFHWKNNQDNLDYETKIKTFFNRSRFLKLIKDYIIFIEKEGELTKIVLRQHQMRAVEKVIDRIQHPLKRRGLVWHTQGSGKTLTMITIASKLLHSMEQENSKPTVVMLIDRNELETQLINNIEAYGISQYKLAKSKKNLIDTLASDYRGLIISMIHKFDDVPANINTRENIVVLVDEAHRTTGGNLGNYLIAALPHATYIGFTGTPIDRIARGEGTFKVFGIDDGQGYLDKYSIAESIEDGTTVKLHYALAPSSLLVDRELLEKEFLNKAEAEGISDIVELNEILKRAVHLKEMMKSSTRVDAIAKFVAQHFQDYVQPMGFKAFLVGVDREACALYKKSLDKYLPAEYSTVVYSPAQNDKEELKKHYLDEHEEKAVRKNFYKKDSSPKILIVTEKLLTGYDAPILYAMYLDKPMRDHVLLQAIARVNRPYEEESGVTKPCGLIFDFVGIFDHLEKALAFDSDEVGSVIENIDVLKQLFEKLIIEAKKNYLHLAKIKTDKDSKKAIEYFFSQETREQFFKAYKQIANLYDILSPDVFLRPYIEDYKQLSDLYLLTRNAYTDRVYTDTEFTEKTKKLLRERTHAVNLEAPFEIHTIDKAALDKLKTSSNSDLIKVLNLSKLLTIRAKEESQQKPYLLSISEMAQNITKAFEQRQITTQEALKRFFDLTEECVNAEEEKENLGLDDNEHAIFIVLKIGTKGITTEDAKKINNHFIAYPDYSWNTEQERKLRAEIYKSIRPLVGADKMIDVANTLLKLKRI